MRINSIDLLKGSLILLVITGHILQGGLTENIARYIIYSFHMPAFIGISGYLFNVDKVKTLGVGNFASKYLFRVIIPWLIASLAYLLLNNYHSLSSHWLTHSLLPKYAALLIKPFYHLWFIPAFLSWITMIWAGKKIGLSDKALLVTSAVISVVFYACNNFPALYQKVTALSRPMEIILFTFRPFFFIFFSLGVYIKQHVKNININIIGAISLLSFATFTALFFFPNKIAAFALFYLFNISLILWLIGMIRKDNLPQNKAVQWIGVNSLGLYLWHVVPIIIVTQLIGTNNLLLFYPAAVGAIALFFVVMIFLTRIKAINKILFGL